MTRDGEPFCMAALIRRASVRQLRLHACGCLRLNAPANIDLALFALVEVAERYADGAAGEWDLVEARDRQGRFSPPEAWDGDIEWAFEDSESLWRSWNESADRNAPFELSDSDYHLALPRHRVFEELLGPDPRPAFSPAWRTDTVLLLARQMYEAREFFAMPILADALQDAGCDGDAILSHCRDPRQFHVRGCWVVDLVLDKH